MKLLWLIKRKDESAQGLVEYALLLVLVAVVVIGILILLGNQVNQAFAKVIIALESVGGSSEYNYAIPTFIISTANVGPPAKCEVRLTTLTVEVTNEGQPVANHLVAASITLQNGANTTLTDTTNASGQITWSDAGILFDDGVCGGRTVTAKTGSATVTRPY